ncbi:MAG: ribbon-helix-helix domain-containing protein [Candidatus Asgardarchaeia archaeon]
MTKNVKVWTTINKKLFDEIKNLKDALGYNSETEVIRDAIRNGLIFLRVRVNLVLQSKFKKRKGAILSAHDLGADIYEELKKAGKLLEDELRKAWR